MKILVIATAVSFALTSASFAATKQPPKPQTVNTHVNHNTKTRPVPPHHTVHLTPQQRHDAAARMMQPIR